MSQFQGEGEAKCLLPDEAFPAGDRVHSTSWHEDAYKVVINAIEIATCGT